MNEEEPLEGATQRDQGFGYSSHIPPNLNYNSYYDSLDRLKESCLNGQSVYMPVNERRETMRENTVINEGNNSKPKINRLHTQTDDQDMAYTKQESFTAKEEKKQDMMDKLMNSLKENDKEYFGRVMEQKKATLHRFNILTCHREKVLEFDINQAENRDDGVCRMTFENVKNHYHRL